MTWAASSSCGRGRRPTRTFSAASSSFCTKARCSRRCRTGSASTSTRRRSTRRRRLFARSISGRARTGSRTPPPSPSRGLRVSRCRRYPARRGEATAGRRSGSSSSSSSGALRCWPRWSSSDRACGGGGRRDRRLPVPADADRNRSEIPSARGDAPGRPALREDEALRRPSGAIRAQPRDHRPCRDQPPLPAHALAGGDHRSTREPHARRLLPYMGTAALADAARGLQDHARPSRARLRRGQALARVAPEPSVATTLQHRPPARALHSTPQGLPVSPRPVKRALLILPLAAVLAGCSGGSSTPTITIKPAKTYQLVDREPASGIPAGTPVTVGFSVQQPSGKALTQFKTGAGPHTGIHLIIVSDDLSTLIHRHPPVAADGHLRQQIVFPKPGNYTVLADIYPKSGPIPNFQLRYGAHVDGKEALQQLPPFKATQVVDGYRVTIHGKPNLRV